MREDVRDGVMFGRRPSNRTLDRCRAPGDDSLCATRNRGGQCPSFKEDEDPMPLVGGPRWQHEKQFEGYDERVAASKAKAKARRDKLRPPRLPQDAPCSRCSHMRHPADIDPFAQVHFNNTEVMQMRDGYRRDRRKRAEDERRICAQPGGALGDRDVPGRQLWCDAYSQRDGSGAIVEFAYCYRALKAHAGDGHCPSFVDRAEDDARWQAAVCGKCGLAGEVVPRDGRIWCTWCSTWTALADAEAKPSPPPAEEPDPEPSGSHFEVRIAANRLTRKLEKSRRRTARGAGDGEGGAP